MSESVHFSQEQLHKIAIALGIRTEGKSVLSLGRLVLKATDKPRAKSKPCIIDPNALSKHFEEGHFTDCHLRVRIRDAAADVAVNRPAKRLRSGRRKATETEGPADEEEEQEEEGVRVVKAHAVILASRSKYFERAMGGEWRESKDRSIEVEVADEEEYVTFRRLIKLCYGTTFITEGDRDLDVSELVRLIHVANAFECMDAVKQCTMALQETDLSWEGALDCIASTETLDDVEGMADLAVKAGLALAKEVGHVHELFTPVKDDDDDGGDVLGGMRLSEKVKALSPEIFEALISSKGLQIKAESETFWLLLAWVEAQSNEREERKQELFTRMAKHLRFHAMDPGYILLMVSEHPRIMAAGLQGRILKGSLARANMARRLSDDLNGYNTVEAYLGELHGPVKTVSWTFDARFNTTETSVIKPREECCKLVGLGAGLPWYIEVYHGEAWKGTCKAAVYVTCRLPFEWMTCGDGDGIYFRHKLEVGVGTPRELVVDKSDRSRFWTEDTVWGNNFANWPDVFREGSEWLVNGVLHVRFTLEITDDQRPLMLDDS